MASPPTPPRSQQHRCCPTLPSYRLRLRPPQQAPLPASAQRGHQGAPCLKKLAPKPLGPGGEAGWSRLNLSLSPWGRLAVGRGESCLLLPLAPGGPAPRPGLASAWGPPRCPSLCGAGWFPFLLPTPFLGTLAPWSRALGGRPLSVLPPRWPLGSRSCRFSRPCPAWLAVPSLGPVTLACRPLPAGSLSPHPLQP